jgi:hypothetical protein
VEFPREPDELGLALVVAGVGEVCKFAAENAEPVGAEDAASEEVEGCIEHDVFLDAEDARVVACVGSGGPAEAPEGLKLVPLSLRLGR